MSHSQRFKELLDSEGLNMTQLCTSINYTLKNLSNYLNGTTLNPNGELVIGILDHYPHWNIRYWLLGQGKLFLTDEVQVVEETTILYKKEDPITKELRKQLDYMQKEIKRKEEEIKFLKAKLN